MFAVLEGLDGAGKSTQVKKLRQYLSEKSAPLEYIHFPRYEGSLYGELVGKYLRGGFGPIEHVHPQLVALLFAEDRRDAAGEIRKNIAFGANVLLDRYVYSNIAYQCAKLGEGEDVEELRKWIFDLEYGRFGIPVPDVNIFLDVPIGFVEKSLAASREGDDNRSYLHGARDIHEEDISFQTKVRDMYRRQAGLDPSFIRVDCADEKGEMLPPDLIFNKIKAIVDAHL